MRPVRRLEDLVVRTERRVIRLRTSLDRSWPLAGDEGSRRLTFAIVEAANLWAQFCRTYYLSTALRAVEANGTRASVASTLEISSRTDAITAAVHAFSKKKRTQPGPFTWFEEPKWHRSSEFLKVVRGTTCSNVSTVEQALSYQSESRDDLIVARNFFAHKSQDTADKLRSRAPQYSLASDVAPFAFVTAVQPGQSQPVVINWLDDLLGSVQLMR